MEAMGFKAGHNLAQVPSCLLSGYFKSGHSLCGDLSLSCNSCPWQEGYPDAMRRAVASLLHLGDTSAPCPGESTWREAYRGWRCFSCGPEALGYGPAVGAETEPP